MTTQCSVCKTGIQDLKPVAVFQFNWTFMSLCFIGDLCLAVFSTTMGVFYTVRVAMFSKKMEQMAAMLYFLNLVFGLLYHVRLVRQGAVEQLLKTVWKVAEDTTLSQSCKFF